MENQSDERTFSRCYAHFFWGTVGSDGNVYPCDHNTYPGAPYYGNAINRAFGELWEGILRSRLIGKGGVFPKICPTPCSPFAQRINPFMEYLQQVFDLEGLAKLEEYRNSILA